ncbi:MAG: GDCCVxC domain-containing (seleno)protein [Candidatus Bipolaricaulia bacterium]
MPDSTLTSTLTCPECGTQTEVNMPTNGCQFFWDCPACGTTLRPESGDCCVFCSYGSVPCPPVQQTSSPSSSCCSD